MGCQWLDVKLKRFFYKLGFWVGSNPWYFLTVPVLLTALCATGTQQENSVSKFDFSISCISNPNLPKLDLEL